MSVQGVDEDGNVTINEINFPDEAFREYICRFVDPNNDGVLSKEEIEGTTSIVIPYNNAFIGNEMKLLDGIQYFSKLNYLDCQFQDIVELDLSSNTELITLICCHNELTELNITGCTSLLEVDCSFNTLTKLDVSNYTSLTEVNCCANELTELNIIGCTSLISL